MCYGSGDPEFDSVIYPVLQMVDVTSVTPRSNWPGEGHNSAAGLTIGSGGVGHGAVTPSPMNPSTNQNNNRQFNMNSSNPPARLNAGGMPPSSHLQDLASQHHSQGSMKPMLPQQPPHRHHSSTAPPPLFSPPATSGMSMPTDVHQPSQGNMFVNGQADMNHGASPFAAPNAPPVHTNNVMKNESQQSSAHFLNAGSEFAPRMDTNAPPMSDFDLSQQHQQQQKDLGAPMSNASSDSLFNALQQQPQHTQPSMSDNKSLGPPPSSPAGLPMPPVSGGKPKSHSAAMAQVRNASSWSSLGASSQQGQGGSSKSSGLVDSFQQFKRQAKEKEARQKALIEQQEMRRQQKEQAERERLRADAERRREREEEEALDKAR